MRFVTSVSAARRSVPAVLALLPLAGCASQMQSAAPAAARSEPVAAADAAERSAPEPAQVWVAPFSGTALGSAAAPLLQAAPTPVNPVDPATADATEEVVSRGRRVNSEFDPVGMYDQPEWTTRRRFARSRVYVLPEGQVEVEQWWRGTFDEGEGPSHRFQSEISFGLPHRFQFDFYVNNEHEDGHTFYSGLQPELRWAPADWGKIPLNPTLYAEYKWNHHAEDVAEGKLLLADDLGKDLHWAVNFSVEQELGGSREQELAITSAVSWSFIDRKLGLGVEFETDRVTAEGSRDDEEWQYYLGPSIQWRPTPATHVDFVPLRGWHDAHDWRVFLIFGIDFGGAKEKGPPGPEPVISKSR